MNKHEGIELPSGVSEQDLKNLVIGLGNLGTHAHRNDITKTAAHLELSVDLVRRYLRGAMYKYETGKAIHDHLRGLTLTRTHSIQQSLTPAA